MSKKKRKNQKIVKMKKPFNIGIVFFGTIFVYLMICVYMYFTSVHVSGYEVIAGSLSTDKEFTGLALRTEEVFYADQEGSVEYYSRAGAKVSASSLVYTIDQTGEMSQLLAEKADEANLTQDSYDSIRERIGSFADSYDREDFESVYEFHEEVKGSIIEVINQELMETMGTADGFDLSMFQRGYAAKSGIVEYYIDGYENVTPETIQAEMFDQEQYEKQILKSMDQISVNAPIYKLITDENWSVIIPMTSEQIEAIAYQNSVDEEGNPTKKLRSVVEVQFMKDQANVWAYVSILNLGEEQYLKLDFNTAVVRYASERYLDLEFLIEDTSGLKIPVSAITEKDFYVILENYLVRGGENDKEGFMIETFDKDGNAAQKFVSPTIYMRKDGMVYINPDEANFATSELYVKSGDRVLMVDSNEVYQVGKTESLEGVYCINQGYTEFRRIDILYSNEEYCILREGTTYGLTIYDRIVLDSSAVNEEQVIY